MTDWDSNSEQLFRNLSELGTRIADDSAESQFLSSEAVRAWHAQMMRGLHAPDGEPAGTFRGEAGLEDYDVQVGSHLGVPAGDVASELKRFDDILSAEIAELDAAIPDYRTGNELTADQLNAVLILCAWAHGEWVKIHPFPNGNGRTARMLANSIALRYGLPAFVRIRPRPGADYEWVADQAMQGNWSAAVPLFIQMLDAALD